LREIGSHGSIIIASKLDEDGNMRIEFTDSGPGIPEEIKTRIFDPFFTTSPEGEGTGLGLSISYYIIKEMQGRLEVESPPGKGATFIVTLPVDLTTEEKIQNAC
jgi:signal transduction histidine kinase